MIKKTGTLLVICCFLMAALPGMAPAVQSVSRQSLIQKNIAGLQATLLTAASTDSTPLHALTVQFLNDLGRVGFKRNTTDLGLAVTQYVNDAQEQTMAAALDPACSPALLISITVNGSNMIQELATYDAPVCEAISLSTSAASIISAKYDYDMCVEEAKETPDPTIIQNLERRKNNIRVYFFTADVLSLAICSTTISVQDIVYILVQLIGLFK